MVLIADFKAVKRSHIVFSSGNDFLKLSNIIFRLEGSEAKQRREIQKQNKNSSDFGVRRIVKPNIFKMEFMNNSLSSSFSYSTRQFRYFLVFKRLVSVLRKS